MSDNKRVKVQLGETVADTITGFKGVVTGRAEYLTGCHQVLVQPREMKDGRYPESRWLDEQRCMIDSNTSIIALENGSTPGFDGPEPHR